MKDVYHFKKETLGKKAFSIGLGMQKRIQNTDIETIAKAINALLGLHNKQKRQAITEVDIQSSLDMTGEIIVSIRENNEGDPLIRGNMKAFYSVHVYELVKVY